MRNLFSLILILTLVLTIISQSVLAYSGIEFTDPAGNDIGTVSNPFSTCPEPITAVDVYVYVTNLGDSSDTFEMSLDVPDDWNEQIQSEIMLGSGERGKLDLFLLNVPSGTNPGIYDVTVTAKSKSDPSDVNSKKFYIEILPCHVVDLDVTDASKEVCEEDKTPVAYNIDITNMGKLREEFSLSASVSWSSFSSNSVELNPDETKTVALTLTPPEGLMGVQNVLVTAQSTSSYAKDTASLQLDIKNCYDFDLNLQPTEDRVCLGKSIDYVLKINNIGLKADTYSISAPGWITLEASTITVEANQKGEITVSVKPEQTGKLSFNIDVSSDNEAGLERSITGTVISNECRSVAAFVFPSQTTVCSGIPVEYTISIKNTGTIEDEFELTSSLGILDKDMIMLGPGETMDVKLDVDTSDLTGTETITIRVSSEAVSDEAKTELVLENCYSATVTVTPDEQSACPYSRINYTVIVENTGELADSYILIFEEFMQEFDLGSGKSKVLTFPVFSDTSGAYIITAKLRSDHHISISDDATLLITPLETCYSVELTAEVTEKSTETNKATVIPVEVKNTGEQPDTFDISVSGPEWVYLSPIKTDLDSGESISVYIYISPPFGTAAGTYTATLSANSLYSQSSIEIDATVISDVTAPPEPPTEPENVTEDGGEEENVTAGDENVTVEGEDNVTVEEADNITLVINDTGSVVIDTTPDNVTGLFLGGDEDRPLWKTVTVAVITIIIIVILIIRFAFLWKK